LAVNSLLIRVLLPCVYKTLALVETHIPCEKCGSSDAKSVYGDGHAYCFSCNTYFKPNDEESVNLNDYTYEFLSWRGVESNSFRTYGVKSEISSDGRPKNIRYTYPNGSCKIRNLSDKVFWSEGEINKAGLFGRDKFSAGSHKYVTITEGELDACSLYQVLGTPVVSVQSSSSAVRDATLDRSWLNAHERIYLAFDNDTAGREAAARVAQLFDYSKVFHVKFTKYKDANEYLQHGEETELRHIWWNAKKYIPENIISSFSDFETILKEPDKPGISYPWPTLTKMTYGIRLGESVLITAQEGVGKTEVMHTIEHKLLKETSDNVAAIYLEEPKRRHLQALAGIELRRPVHLPDTDVSHGEVAQALKKVVNGDDRLFIYSHFGSDDPGILLDVIRFMASGCACRYILLDHITMAVSGLGAEDERRALDRLSTALEMMVKELNFSLIIVSHVNDEGQTRGSRYISKIADIRIDLKRDLLNSDALIRNTTDLIVSKNRFCGRTGSAGSILFDPLTYSYTENSDDTDTKGTETSVSPSKEKEDCAKRENATQTGRVSEDA
jgi:twinkle protein